MLTYNKGTANIRLTPEVNWARQTYFFKEELMKVFKIDQVKKEPTVSPMFTGPVTMQNVIGPELSKRFMIRQVNFDTGVKNKFHTHTIEQILIISEGKGIVATEKEEIIVGPGDIIFIPAGEKHWHGAAKGSTFSHLYVMSPDSKTTKLED
jgi:quercetin dioxygenase-like cupin family protein